MINGVSGTVSEAVASHKQHEEESLNSASSITDAGSTQPCSGRGRGAGRDRGRGRGQGRGSWGGRRGGGRGLRGVRGARFVRRMESRGIMVVVTGDTDPLAAATACLDGKPLPTAQSYLIAPIPQREIISRYN